MINTHSTSSGESPFAHTRATEMLSTGIRAQPNLSQRSLAQALGYKSSVVISHMASGRAPIPVDRAVDIAEAVGLDQGQFLLAVLEQRFPNTDFRGLFSIPTAFSVSDPNYQDRDIVTDLERIAGAKLADLPSERIDIVKDVLSDRDPARRWLTLKELPFVEELRTIEPGFKVGGLSAATRAQIMEAVRSI